MILLYELKQAAGNCEFELQTLKYVHSYLFILLLIMFSSKSLLPPLFPRPLSFLSSFLLFLLYSLLAPSLFLCPFLFFPALLPPCSFPPHFPRPLSFLSHFLLSLPSPLLAPSLLTSLFLCPFSLLFSFSFLAPFLLLPSSLPSSSPFSLLSSFSFLAPSFLLPSSSLLFLSFPSFLSLLPPCSFPPHFPRPLSFPSSFLLFLPYSLFIHIFYNCILL